MGVCCIYVTMVMILCLFIEQKYGRETLIIPVDFSHGMEIYPSLAKQLKDLDIGILGENNGTLV